MVGFSCVHHPIEAKLGVAFVALHGTSDRKRINHGPRAYLLVEVSADVSA